MATTDVALHEAPGQREPKRIVNNMSIQVATVNGSGSQSSNTVLLRKSSPCSAVHQLRVYLCGSELGTWALQIAQRLPEAISSKFVPGHCLDC